MVDAVSRGDHARSTALSLISRSCLQESLHAMAVSRRLNASGRARSLSFSGKISPIRGASAVSRVERGLVSIVVPVFNESANLPSLWARLKPVLDGLDRPWETLLIAAGSRADSLRILREIALGDQVSTR